MGFLPEMERSAVRVEALGGKRGKGGCKWRKRE
jgi:hypothetical protein